ncbi:hypothetical protein FRC06_009076 [Ceratobasidium sp. 370]|nr:hypothetical protein FRC06_009076 [Ceratobasidium sp. 370]
MATQLYSSPLPFGQIVIDPAHAGTDQQKHAVFHKVITAGYCIFYEFPSDPMNPLPPTTPTGSARGLLFFSTPIVPSRILFKVFITHPCPPALCRGGQPAGPGLMGHNGNANANGAAAANGASGGGTVPGAGAAPALVPAGVASVGAGLPGVGLGGQPNAGAKNMFGTQAQGAMPGTGLVAGMVPGDGMIPGAGAGARPNAAPVPPNVNANPAVGINPGMMQGLNAGGIPGLGSPAMQGLGISGGVPGLNPNNAPSSSQAAHSQASPSVNQLPRRHVVYRVVLARLGFTPAQFVSATQQQKANIMQQMRRELINMKQRQGGQR